MTKPIQFNRKMPGMDAVATFYLSIFDEITGRHCHETMCRQRMAEIWQAALDSPEVEPFTKHRITQILNQ